MSYVLKTCKDCKKEFPATIKFFYRTTNKKKGLSSYCKKCHIYRTVSDAEDKARIDATKVKECRDCKKTYPNDTVHFRSLPRTKSDIGRYCVACHELRTNIRREFVKQNSQKYRLKMRPWIGLSQNRPAGIICD